MRWLVLAALIGCAYNTGPVSGAGPAHARRYPVSAADALAAVRAELGARYGIAAGAAGPTDARVVVAVEACRTKSGDPCNNFHDSEPAGGSSHWDPAIYYVQLRAELGGDDGAISVRLDARITGMDHHGQLLLGDPRAPAWVQHEVDVVQVAIDHRLAPPR